MTIWLLTILLLASLAGLGWRQGAIRVVFSLLGIVFGALLAAPIGHLLRPLVGMVGLKDPLTQAFIPPVVVFLIVLTLFKVGGLVVHRKTEVYYKYQAGDLRLVLWERLNHRVGLCLGLLNGTAYLVLASMGIYMLSYWTYQMATPETSPTGLKLLNRLGEDLQKTGLSSVARAADRMPESYYDSADIVGVVYHNPQVESRLSRYPAFLALSERQEFKDLANDQSISNLLRGQGSIMDLLQHPRAQAILKNPELVKTISSALLPNLKDLRGFLETGQSALATERIVGRFDFDIAGTISQLRKAKPNMSAKEVGLARASLLATFSRTVFVAAPAPESQAFLENFPQKANAVTIAGQWKGGGGKYDLTFTVDGRSDTFSGEFQGERFVLSSSGLSLAFSRQE